MKNNAKMGAENIFVASVKEFKLLHTVVFCGLMGALSVILKMVASIKVGPYINIGFAWIPNRIVEFMFGPVVGSIFGGIMDIVKFFAKSDGEFDILYTMVPMIAGLVCGIILYKKKVTIFRVFAAQVFLKLFINTFLNTYLMSIKQGEAMMNILPARAIKNLVMLPIDTLILFTILTAIANILPRLGKYGER